MAAIASPRKSTTVLNSVRFATLRTSFALGSWLMPQATLQRGFRLFGTPMPGSRARARAADTAGATLRHIEFGSARVACYSWGDTEHQPIALLAHGWSGYGLQWLPWVEPLRKAGYAVVTFDQVAHGRSSGQRATLPMFADVLQRVAQCHRTPDLVMGHSLGGAATTVALARGLRAKRTALIAPAADPFEAARRFGGIVGLAPHLSARLFEEFESLTGIAARGLQAHLAAPCIASPALVVHDLEDREVPWSEGERYARYWPHARLLTTSGLGHNRILADAEVIRRVIDFLNGAPVGERVVSSPNLPFGIA